MQNQKELKRKIKTIANIRKVTKAMEMISSIRLQRALRALESARAYSSELLGFVSSIVKTLEPSEVENLPLFEVRPAKELLFIVLSSDKGLCGTFNSRLLARVTGDRDREQAAGKKIRVIAVGKKAAETLKRKGFDVVSSFPGLTEETSMSTAEKVTEECVRAFTEARADEIYIYYNHFISTGKQDVFAFKLFPVAFEKLDYPGFLPVREAPIFQSDLEGIYHITKFLFEPEGKTLLPGLLMRYCEMMTYETFLESFASEHAARMVAMQQSTNNADELTSRLAVIYNKARQSMITSEIIEVINSAEALS